MEFCAQHVPDGMVNVYSRKCRTKGCRKQSLFSVAGLKTVEYCAQHAPDGMVNVGRNNKNSNVEEYRRRKANPHNSEKETVVSARPSGVKRKAVDAANASSPSDDSRGSHKRAR
ncbi:unnamed protein product, partial [Ascophyllum nodosum]